jgi:predicted O-linked N-acetylglucosamine transferase (SPINDLY family)
VQHVKNQRLLQAAVVHLNAGRLAAAAALCSQARAAAPRDFDALFVSGAIALKQESFDDAARWLAKAARLSPGNAPCALRLGFALAKLGRNEEAEGALGRAVSLVPADAEAWDTLGFVLKARGKLEEAIAAHRRAAGLNPGRALSWHNLGSALVFAGRLSEALEAHERAVLSDPSAGYAIQGRALALQGCHRIPEAVEAYGEALRLCPSDHASRSYRLMALNYLDCHGPERLLAEHLAYGAAVGGERPRKFINTPDPGRRLRVAFLSPDLRTHSVAFFLEPLLAHLDRAEFDVILYHDHFIVDATSDRLRSAASHWRNFVGLQDDAVEALILADRPDILVDLAGHTGLNRLPLLARRLAPVQVSYLGYPNTTGVRAVDYRFVDGITDPVGIAEQGHTERIVRFAATAWSYAPPADSPEPAAPPSVCGAPVTFGCFNNFSKVSDAAIGAWSRLLGEFPDSRLRLKSTGLGEGAVAGRALRRLRNAGLDPERVDIMGHTPTIASHLALYHGVDVALDTFPYNGTTTTCEALWMGVPVITLAGRRHASRVGASLLGAVGHAEWITRDWVSYVAAAAHIAADGPNRQVIARTLRDSMKASPLLDHAGQARRFGGALRQTWAAWCGGLQAAA